MTRKQAEKRLRAHQRLFRRDHGRVPPVILVGWNFTRALMGNIYSKGWNPSQEQLAMLETDTMRFEGSLVSFGFDVELREEALLSPIRIEDYLENKAQPPMVPIPGLEHQPWHIPPPLETLRQIAAEYPAVTVAGSAANRAYLYHYEDWGWAHGDQMEVADMILPDFLHEVLPVVYLPEAWRPTGVALN
jgi:hypothetical protein